MCRSPSMKLSMGAQTVFWASLLFLNMRVWAGAPMRMARLNRAGRVSRPRKMTFLTGERPMYSYTSSRAARNTSMIFTPEGQAASQEPHSRQRPSLSATARGSRIISWARLLTSASLPRATSASIMVAPNMGQTCWQKPHFIQATIRSSSVMRRRARDCRSFMPRLP